MNSQISYAFECFWVLTRYCIISKLSSFNFLFCFLTFIHNFDLLPYVVIWQCCVTCSLLSSSNIKRMKSEWSVISGCVCALQKSIWTLNEKAILLLNDNKSWTKGKAKGRSRTLDWKDLNQFSQNLKQKYKKRLKLNALLEVNLHTYITYLG